MYWFSILLLFKLGDFYLGREYILEQKIIMSQKEIVKINFF